MSHAKMWVFATFCAEYRAHEHAASYEHFHIRHKTQGMTGQCGAVSRLVATSCHGPCRTPQRTRNQSVVTPLPTYLRAYLVANDQGTDSCEHNRMQLRLVFEETNTRQESSRLSPKTEIGNSLISNFGRIWYTFLQGMPPHISHGTSPNAADHDTHEQRTARYLRTF